MTFERQEGRALVVAAIRLELTEDALRERTKRSAAWAMPTPGGTAGSRCCRTVDARRVT